MAMRGIARHGRHRPKALICRSFCRPWDASGGRSLWVIIIKIWYKVFTHFHDCFEAQKGRSMTELPPSLAGDLAREGTGGLGIRTRAWGRP